jgi:hypothetical protein
MKQTDLSQYMNRQDLLKETLAAINKDLLSAGEAAAVDEAEEVTYMELVEKLSPVIEVLFTSRITVFMNLMYRIDIPQEKLDEIISGNSENIIVRITELIIKRELQKVVIRNFYRNKS